MKDKPRINGKEYWRSLDQLGNTPEFREWVEREFPQGASEMDNSWSRRSFLTIMGASMALAGLAGCRRPVEKIVPYVKAPEEIIPGIAQKYATTMPSGNYAYGLVVESHEGRPTKLEGNALHPSSLGKSTAEIQSTILDLYDPDRSQSLLEIGVTRKWDDFVAFWLTLGAEYSAKKGAGLAVLSEPFSSPTMMRLKTAFTKRYPKAKWVSWAPSADENIYTGIALASGKRLRPIYAYAKAKVLLSIDSDFLLTENDSIVANLGFAKGRSLDSEKDEMNRLYTVESLYSPTGAMADHRLRLKPTDIANFAFALADELSAQGLKHSLRAGLGGSLSASASKWLKPLAKDLLANKGRSLVLAGANQPPEIHALVMVLNDALGNNGKTVEYVEPLDSEFSDMSSFKTLTKDMRSGKVGALVMLGGNPVYNAPVDLEFSKALKKVKRSIHLSERVDETSNEVLWHIPKAHYLESWGDTRSADGTVGMIQPLIEPLFNGKSAVELLSLIVTGQSVAGHDLVRETWKPKVKSNFEKTWRRYLHDGVIKGTAYKAVRVSANGNKISRQSKVTDGYDIVFHTCRTLGTQGSANNGWLQELPDPITKISWDNVATISPATAKDLGVANEDMVRITLNGHELSIPAWIVPGHADHCVGLALGYGHTRSGRVGNNVGVNCSRLRNSSSLAIATGAKVERTTGTFELANLQDHGSMEGRPIVREATIEEYRKDPEVIKEMVEHPPLLSLWDDYEYTEGYQWGMAIDLTTCSGCNACTIACQSENNIPIVGKVEARKGREMHWIRIDRYFSGSVEEPEMVHQPVACAHCELAPCEQVCPVAATTHDKEGLNTMVYNRCIGTRYCANNCPYKVRRFNFFNFTKDYPEVVKMAQNPDVTVRSRGVMEKCSYCVQRINAGKKTAKLEKREVRDGDIVVACQQACPADAITFGNLMDKNSKVSKMKKRNRDYHLLQELNIKPRTSYLAKIRNPNPEMPS